MENHRLVLPEHMNHYGFLFGGYLLAWVDELAWMAASRDFPGCQLVTVGMKEVAFKKSVREGTILSLRGRRPDSIKTTRLDSARNCAIRFANVCKIQQYKLQTFVMGGRAGWQRVALR